MRSVPSWNSYFIEIAKTVANRSKDPNTQVGAVIVDNKNRIVSTGYNGFPSNMLETSSLWEKPIKYKYVLHAEANAICYSNKELNGYTLYVSIFPCIECAKLIIAAGIKKVVYNEYKYFKKEVQDFLLSNDIEVIKIEK